MDQQPPAYREQSYFDSGSSPSKICQHFLRGSCRFGEDCYNKHQRDSQRQGASGSRAGSCSPKASRKDVCQHFLRGNCRFGDKCRSEHQQGSQQQNGSEKRQRQGHVVETSHTSDAKSNDLLRVSCAYGERDNKPAVFTRAMLQDCTWHDALFKFRQEFPSISSKKSDKVCFEGRFNDPGGKCRWERIPSQEFGEMVHELRIKVYRSADNAWE